MNKVKRAVIVAAGIGQRMRPLTLTTPKPLISVNGTRMIDSVIAALHANGITEIHVVVGWLKEAFASLPEQYPGLTLIENPYFDSCNNIVHELLRGYPCLISFFLDFFTMLISSS